MLAKPQLLLTGRKWMTSEIVDWMPHWISVTIVKKATETYKLLMNEIGDERRDGKRSSALELEEVILFKWPYSPKQSTDLK